MFGIGWSEFVLIALVLLIFVGPKHLPSVLKKAGIVIGELKRASRELQHQVSEEVRDIERSIGDVKSPNALLRDLVDDIGQGLKDPYAEIRESEKTFQAEMKNIKSEIEGAGVVARIDEREAGPETIREIDAKSDKDLK